MEITKKSKTFNLALDLVEDGKDIQIENINKDQLPPNVTSKMLKI